ncbi:hypothetical protein EJB05_54205, partial [Eragrostis curvula]
MCHRDLRRRRRRTRPHLRHSLICCPDSPTTKIPPPRSVSPLFSFLFPRVFLSFKNAMENSRAPKAELIPAPSLCLLVRPRLLFSGIIRCRESMAMTAPWSSSCCAGATTSAPRVVPASGVRGERLRWAAGASLRRCRQQGRRRNQLSVRATAAPPPPVDHADTGAGAGAGTGTADVASLKIKLLSAVSGLNRGLAASQEDLDRADAAARALEAAAAAAGCGPVDLNKDLDRLQGRWRLLYSSAFSSRTLGGSRPGPPTGRLLPITLGQVFQRVDVVSRDFDNIVELEIGAPWPFPPVEATATLAHKFEIVGTSGIKITFEKTTVKTKGNLSQLPPLELPRIPDNLRPPSNTGSGEFEVTYLDDDTRITRGDRGELRVFVIS